MWNPDDAERWTERVEDWVRSDSEPPVLGRDFRDRVLAQLRPAAARSGSVHRLQTLITGLLALSLLVGLPGYYRSLRDDRSPTTLVVDASATTNWPAWNSTPALTIVPRSQDIEWGLVDAALAARDEQARLLFGPL
jgi:hypothetical protein